MKYDISVSPTELGGERTLKNNCLNLTLWTWKYLE